MVKTQIDALIESDSLFKAAEKLPAVVERTTGVRPSNRTGMRWFIGGICGEKLKVISVGRVRMTRASWLFDFFERVAEARDRTGKPSPRPSRRRRTPVAGRR